MNHNIVTPSHTNAWPVTADRPAPTRAGWVCSKCGRSYGPMAIECWVCNIAITRRDRDRLRGLSRGILRPGARP